MNKIEFSVIIPVFHGGFFLHKSLVSMRQVNYPLHCFEVLVAGTRDNDQSRKMVEDEAATAEFYLRYIECANPRRSSQLNAACAVARGRVLVFADDDCIFLPDWLNEIHQALQREPNIGAIGGTDQLEHNGSAFALALDWILSSPLVTGHLRQSTKPGIVKYYPKLYNMAVPHSVALDVALGGKEGIPRVFDTRLLVHEDVELANRIEQTGKQLVFAPKVCVGHYRNTAFRSFVMRNFNLARTSRRLGVHRLPHMLLAIFFLGMVAVAICSVFFRPLRSVLLIYIAIYVVSVLISAISALKRTKRVSMLALVPLLLASLHLTRALGYLFPRRKWDSEEVHF
jgi:glycosyltransferase involved in cell wall biosynthesis